MNSIFPLFPKEMPANFVNHNSLEAEKNIFTFNGKEVIANRKGSG